MLAALPYDNGSLFGVLNPMPRKITPKGKLADLAIDAGYVTPNEAAEWAGQSRQAIRQRALRRGVNAKERREARILKTFAELGKLLQSKGN